MTKETKVSSGRVRTVREGDEHFLFVDGMIVYRRAGFEISERCPQVWKTLILEAIDKGYIKPVAYIKDSELTWEILKNE